MEEFFKEYVNTVNIILAILALFMGTLAFKYYRRTTTATVESNIKNGDQKNEVNVKIESPINANDKNNNVKSSTSFERFIFTGEYEYDDKKISETIAIRFYKETNEVFGFVEAIKDGVENYFILAGIMTNNDFISCHYYNVNKQVDHGIFILKKQKDRQINCFEGKLVFYDNDGEVEKLDYKWTQKNHPNLEQKIFNYNSKKIKIWQNSLKYVKNARQKLIAVVEQINFQLWELLY